MYRRRWGIGVNRGMSIMLRLKIGKAFVFALGFMAMLLACGVEQQSFGVGRAYAEGVVIRDISETAQSLLGQNLYDRLRKLMGRRGISL